MKLYEGRFDCRNACEQTPRKQAQQAALTSLPSLNSATRSRGSTIEVKSTSRWPVYPIVLFACCRTHPTPFALIGNDTEHVFAHLSRFKPEDTFWQARANILVILCKATCHVLCFLCWCLQWLRVSTYRPETVMSKACLGWLSRRNEPIHGCVVCSTQ